MDKFALKVQKGLITKAEADRRRKQSKGINAPSVPLPKNVVTPQAPRPRRNVSTAKSKTQFNMSSIPSMSVNPSTGTVTVKATDIWTTVDFEMAGTVVKPKTGEVGVNPTILASLDAFKSYRYVRFVGLRVTWSPIVSSDTGIFALCVTNKAMADKTVYNIANVSNGRVGSIGKELSVDANFTTYNDDWYMFDQVFRYISFWASSSVSGPCGLLKISYVVEVNNADAVPKPLKLVDSPNETPTHGRSRASSTGSSSGFTVKQLEQMLAQARMIEASQKSSSFGAGVGGSSGNTGGDPGDASTLDSNQGAGGTSA